MLAVHFDSLTSHNFYKLISDLPTVAWRWILKAWIGYFCIYPSKWHVFSNLLKKYSLINNCIRTLLVHIFHWMLAFLCFSYTSITKCKHMVQWNFALLVKCKSFAMIGCRLCYDLKIRQFTITCNFHCTSDQRLLQLR